MPAFVAKRYEQILTQMLAQVVARTGLSDVSDSGGMKHVLAAAARQDDEQYFQMVLLLQLFSIDTATGDDLDERAADIQPGIITRNAAVKASGNLQFSRPGTVGTITIPAGTKAKTAGGKVFTTTAIGTIANLASTSGLIPAIADEAGADGNVGSATIVKLVTKPTGVTGVTNPALFANGLDKESDDSFRNRLKLFINALAKSTVDALEYYVLGAQDSATGATILFSKAIEDQANRGEVTLYIDDGTGSAESSAETKGTDLTGTYTWDGTTTVKIPDATVDGLQVGDWIGLRADATGFQVFKISVINTAPAPDEITILNPGALTIPVGATTSFENPENVTEGLLGPPPDHAAGGETRLYLNNVPVKDGATYVVFSSTRGILTLNTHYTLNSAAGQLVFSPALAVGEAIHIRYNYYTGLIALAQKIIDGDASDRENYPGVRAGGILVWVRTPTVLTQTVNVTITILEGYDHTTVKAAVSEAIKGYINTLGISGDVVRSELIKRIMGVAGVYNVNVVAPTTDVILLDDEMARITTPVVN